MKRAIKLPLIALAIFLFALILPTILIALDINSAINNIKVIKSSISNSSVISDRHFIELGKELNNIEAFTSDPLISPVVKYLIGDTRDDFKLTRNLIPFAPEIMGAKKPKKYLIVFQNPAEARGTGGIIGAYAEIEINKGKLSILKSGSNLDLKSQEIIPISMPEEYKNLYGEDPAIWQNSNISPHFPYAVRIWSALWAKQFNENLDGVIATDPIALSEILKVTGPVYLSSGEAITSSNAVEKTLSTAYQRFESDNNARKIYLVEIMKAVINRLIDKKYSKLKLAMAVRESIHNGRIQIGFLNSQIENSILNTNISGSLNKKSEKEFRAVIINTAGNKLDYYLSRSVNIKEISCGNLGKTILKVEVRNNLRRITNLSDYVKGRLDLKLIHGNNGSQGFALMLYGPDGSDITSAIRSNPIGEDASISSELNRPIAIFRTELGMAKSEKFEVIFSGGYGPLVYKEQPLVNSDKVKISQKCGK